MIHRPSLALAAVLLALSASAQAHRPWLLPSASEVDGKEPWVTVDAAVSENLFDADTVAIKLDNLAITGPDGQPVKPEAVFHGKLRASAEVKLSQPGTYKFSLQNTSAMASYTVNGESKRWRGPASELDKALPAQAEGVQVLRTVQRLETYVSANANTDKTLAASGAGLELLPLSHPGDLRVGERARFRVLLNGQPLANQEVAIVPGGVRQRGVLKDFAATSDAKGEFSVNWPFAQMYWLQASYPPRAPAPAAGQPRPPMPAERFVTAITVEAQQP